MQRLLIADAFGSVTEKIKLYFTRRGYRVDVVTDGQECLAKMQNGHPDALILDDDLPCGGGRGVLDWMRRGGLGTQIPVVLMTEKACPEGDEPLVACHLRRPFDVGTLYESVSLALTPQRQYSNGLLTPTHRRNPLVDVDLVLPAAIDA